MNTECKECEFREGDCGHHFISDGATNYNIASLSACDKYGNCYFFKPKTKPKGDLVSREALREQTKEVFCKRRCPVRDDEPYCHPDCAARLFINIIDNAPTVDCTWIISGRRYGKKEEALKYLRPKGKWIPQTDFDGFTYWKCSECGKVYEGKTNFCPNCGADMRKEADND